MDSPVVKISRVELDFSRQSVYKLRIGVIKILTEFPSRP